MTLPNVFRAIALVALATTTAQPQAAPVFFATGIQGVTGSLDESLDQFTLSLSGGTVATNAQTSVPIALGLHWPMQLTITLNDTDADFVVLSGIVFHKSQPHPPEGNGTPNNFSFIMLGGSTSLPSIVFNGKSVTDSGGDILDHELHYDAYTGTAQPVMVGQEIISWSASLTGTHLGTVPEPSVLLLLGSGLAGLALCGNCQRGGPRRRRAKHT